MVIDQRYLILPAIDYVAEFAKATSNDRSIIKGGGGNSLPLEHTYNIGWDPLFIDGPIFCPNLVVVRVGVRMESPKPGPLMPHSLGQGY